MPALITNIQDRVKAKRIENINQKLSEATDKMAVQSGLTGYGTTMAFVQEMAKHMKIAKICDNSHLAECWPTQEVILNDEGKTWEISKTKNAKTLKISSNAENWDDTVGIVTADGTGMILSYDKTCSFDVNDIGLVYNNSTGKSNSLGCLSGVFDWNGGSKPNKLGKDVTTLGTSGGLGQECAVEAGGVCFTALIVAPSPLTYAECNKLKGELGIKYCGSNSDYWAGAVKACGGVSNMPTMDDLAQLASQLYKGNPKIGAHQNVSNVQWNQDAATSLGFTSSNFNLWSGEEGSNGYSASYRYFDTARTLWISSNNRSWSSTGKQVLCKINN